MDLAVGIVFYLLGVIFFFASIYEEREEKETEEGEYQSDDLVVILLVITLSMFFIGGICMMYVTETYYSTVTEELIEVLIPSYMPLGWFGIGFAMLCALFLVEKVFYLFEKRIHGE